MQYLFIGILFMLALFGCRDKAAQAEAAAAAEQARLDSMAARQSPEVKKICLDTAWLHDHGFTYQMLRTINGMQWTMSYPMPIEQLPQALGGSFIFTATSDTSCSDISMSLTAISIDLGKQTQELKVPDYFFHTMPALLEPDIEFDDYNFDGSMDFSIYTSASGQSNIMRSYFLFDKISREYTFSPLISLSNATFNQDEKTISSHWNGGHAGRIGGTAIYRYYNADSLLLLQQSFQDFNDSLDAYIRVERKRLNDGTYAESIDTIFRSAME